MIVLKILLWILLSILGIIIIACIIPADVDFSYLDGKLKYKIKLWFFDLMDSSKEGFLDKRKKKKKKKKKKDKKKKDEDIVLDDDIVFDDDDEDNGSYKPKTSKLEKLGGIWLAAKNPAAMIFKGFKFRNFYIDFIIADEDAYKCAVKYGRYSTLTYNGLSLFSRLFSIRFRTVDIQPGFGLDKGRWDTSFSVRFRLGTAVIAGIWFLITYIFRVLLPKKLKARRINKTAAAQDQ